MHAEILHKPGTVPSISAMQQSHTFALGNIIRCQSLQASYILLCAAPWTGLDASQLKAVGLALSSQDIALVHGPPGTGTHVCGKKYFKAAKATDLPPQVSSQCTKDCPVMCN